MSSTTTATTATMTPKIIAATTPATSNSIDELFPTGEEEKSRSTDTKSDASSSSSSSSNTATSTHGTSSTRFRLIFETLNEIDEMISRPVFALRLPKWFELVYSFPAHIFGSSFCVMVMPLWIATVSLSSKIETIITVADNDEEDYNNTSHNTPTVVMTVAVLKTITICMTALYFVTWMCFQHYEWRDLLGTVVYQPNLYLLGCPWNVALLLAVTTVLNKNIATTSTNSTTNDIDVVFSMAMYPLFLFPVLLKIVGYLKNTTKRHRPAYKDCNRIGIDDDKANKTKKLWTEQKNYPLMTEVLAKYNGDASFPSGDAALATLFSIPIYCIGNNDEDDVDGAGSRYYYKIIASSIVFLSASGRMYVLAHHFFDVSAGILLSLVLHQVVTSLGFGMNTMKWWYPLLTNFIYFGYEKWNENINQTAKNDSPSKQE